MELSDATEKKNPATPGIDPGTLRLAVQFLNHYVTPGPQYLEKPKVNKEHPECYDIFAVLQLVW
jgi:hypothetical protein